MNRYYSTSAYASAFDPARLFRNADEARSHDAARSADLIGRADSEAVAAVLNGADTPLRQAIAFVHAEMPDVVRAAD